MIVVASVVFCPYKRFVSSLAQFPRAGILEIWNEQTGNGPKHYHPQAI